MGRWGDSNTCRDCQGESNWSPSSPGKCAKRKEVVATCSDQGQYYFNGGCEPDCSEIYWEGRQLAANASEAMCSVAQVAEYMEREVPYTRTSTWTWKVTLTWKEIILNTRVKRCLPW